MKRSKLISITFVSIIIGIVGLYFYFLFEPKLQIVEMKETVEIKTVLLGEQNPGQRAKYSNISEFCSLTRFFKGIYVMANLVKQFSYLATFLFLLMVVTQAYAADVKVKEYKVLPKSSEIAPPPPPDRTAKPGVNVVKSSNMGSPQIQRHIANFKNQIDKQGYREVDDESMLVLSLDVMKKDFMPVDEVMKLSSSPLAVISTKTGLFKTMELVGTIATSPTKDTQKMSRVMRYFALANGNVLLLTEFDFKAAKNIVTLPEELVNESINGLPAMYTVKKTKRGGETVTELLWSTKNKFYSLKMEGVARGVGAKNELVILATGIQDSNL